LGERVGDACEAVRDHLGPEVGDGLEQGLGPHVGEGELASKQRGVAKRSVRTNPLGGRHGVYGITQQGDVGGYPRLDRLRDLVRDIFGSGAVSAPAFTRLTGDTGPLTCGFAGSPNGVRTRVSTLSRTLVHGDDLLYLFFQEVLGSNPDLAGIPQLLIMMGAHDPSHQRRARISLSEDGFSGIVLTTESRCIHPYAR
jgi:hypothetical protein